METTTVTFSRTSAILKCILIVLAIALVISQVNDTANFFKNLLEWQSI